MQFRAKNICTGLMVCNNEQIDTLMKQTTVTMTGVGTETNITGDGETRILSANVPHSLHHWVIISLTHLSCLTLAHSLRHTKQQD